EKRFADIYDIDESKENDVDVLRLLVKSLKAQLEEQGKLNVEQIKCLEEDRILREKEFKQREARDFGKIDELQKKNQKLETIVRENTRELLEKNKKFQQLERKIKEEKVQLAERLKSTTETLNEERAKINSTEKRVEEKIKKRTDTLVNDLRSIAAKFENEAKDAKLKYEHYRNNTEKKMESLERKAQSACANLNALKQRRQREIEGFTNDINLLKKQVKILEDALIQQQKMKTLDDKELLLLNLAKETGIKASKMSNELRNLKSKMYRLERDAHQLAF
ncbi:hypothetical protein ROZALSC1DRAFT_31297, partial [Rozella allomycis CSF55]